MNNNLQYILCHTFVLFLPCQSVIPEYRDDLRTLELHHFYMFDKIYVSNPLIVLVTSPSPLLLLATRLNFTRLLILHASYFLHQSFHKKKKQEVNRLNGSRAFCFEYFQKLKLVACLFGQRSH